MGRDNATIRASPNDETDCRWLSHGQVVDLTAVAGTYVGVAMILAMAEEGVPADKEPPFRDGEP